MISEGRRGVFLNKPFSSFGEWLHTHRTSSGCRWDRIVEVTGKAKPTIQNMERDLKQSPETLERRVPRAFIERICEVLNLDQAARDEGFYLGGWSLKVEPTANLLPTEAVGAIAQITRTALLAISDVCAACGLDPVSLKPLTEKETKFTEEDSPRERLRYRDRGLEEKVAIR